MNGHSHLEPEVLLYTHLGYPLNFIFAFHGQVKGAYLCLAEVNWVKTGVPGVKPLLRAKGWVLLPEVLFNLFNLCTQKLFMNLKYNL